MCLLQISLGWGLGAMLYTIHVFLPQTILWWGRIFLEGHPWTDDQDQRSGSHKFSRVKPPSGKARCLGVENLKQKRAEPGERKQVVKRRRDWEETGPSVSSSPFKFRCTQFSLLLSSILTTEKDNDIDGLLITLNRFFFHLIKLKWECKFFWNFENPTRRGMPDIKHVHEMSCFWRWCPPSPILTTPGRLSVT